MDWINSEVGLGRVESGLVFTARRYATARYSSYGPVFVCLSVHRSELYRNGRTDRADFLTLGLPSTCPTLCCKEIDWISLDVEGQIQP